MAVEKFRAEFGVNHRLRWAFRICLELGIDAPITWLNHTPHHVLDAWVAYKVFELDQEEEAHRRAASKGQSQDVGLAFDQLGSMVSNGI